MSTTSLSSTFVSLRSLLVVACALGLALALLFPAPVRAIGLSPPEVYVDGLLRGTTQYRTVFLSRAPNEMEDDVHIRVEPDASSAEYFVLSTQDIVMVGGQQSVAYAFGVTPGAAPNGEHEWLLRFLKTAAPIQAGKGATVTVVTGVTARIHVTVGGEEKLAYELGSIDGQETEEGQDAPFLFVINNTGNVDWHPSKIEFAFFNDLGEEVARSELTGDEVPVSRAGQEGQRFQVRIPAELVQGIYTVVASFYHGEEMVGTLTTTNAFTVHPPGTLEQSGQLLGLSASKEEFAPDEKIKVSATFQNDGQVDVDAVLTLELSRDGETIDFVRSKEYEVRPGSEFVFIEFLSALPVGSYVLNGLVEYGNRQTQPSQATFEVREPSSAIAQGGKRLNSLAGIVGLAVAVIAIAMVIVAAKRRRRHHDGGSPPTPPAPPTSPAPPTPPANAAPAPVSSTSPPPPLQQNATPVQAPTPEPTTQEANYPHPQIE